MFSHLGLIRFMIYDKFGKSHWQIDYSISTEMWYQLILNLNLEKYVFISWPNQIHDTWYVDLEVKTSLNQVILSELSIIVDLIWYSNGIQNQITILFLKYLMIQSASQKVSFILYCFINCRDTIRNSLPRLLMFNHKRGGGCWYKNR